MNLLPEPSDQTFRLIVDAAPNAIVVVDQDGRMRYVNVQTERLFGYQRTELLGAPIEMLVPERYRRAHPALRQSFYVNVQMRPMGAGRDLYGLRKDGTEFPIEIGLNPLETDEGMLVLSSILDVTDRKRLEQELRLRVEELATADRQKDEFLAMLGHELRNPLAPMRNAVHLMKLPGADSRSLQRARDVVERQLQHLVRLVDDLLDVSRIISGRIELRHDIVDLADAVSRANETAQPIVEARGHHLVISLPEQPVRVEGDLVRLSQVIANLLTNAAKYTQEPDRIELTVEAGDDEATIRVRDYGIGIAPEFLPRVFHLFVQVDSSLARSQGGLGIGLTLVKRLVAMQNGTVTASSRGIGHGSEFVVRLPLVREELAPAGARRAVENAADEALPQRVLVVDDNIDAAETVAAILKVSGYSVRCEYGGRAALQAVETYHPDVIVLDIGLPDMTGYDVAARLRSNPRFRDIPLIAVTGYGQESDRRRSRDVGIDHHMTKPVDPEALTAFIASYRTDA